MNNVIWPFSLLCKSLPIAELDGMTIVATLAKPNPPRWVSCALGVHLFALLIAAVVFKSYGNTNASLISAGSFVGTILFVLALDKLLVKCSFCGGRLKNYAKRDYPYKNHKYDLNGKKCVVCNKVQIFMCINTALKSDG
jgi:hypothetical protein